MHNFNFTGTPEGRPLSPGGTTSMTVYLNRHTGFDRSCRIRFNMKIGDGPESGIRDEVNNADGRSFGWLPR